MLLFARKPAQECKGLRLVSNSGMEKPNHTEQRLTDLEIKVSFHEDQLDQLNQVIVRQQQELDLLLREVRHLRHLVPDGAPPVAGRAGDELPPHY